MSHDPINIAAAADDRYAPHLGVTIKSIVINNPLETFNFYIIDAGITPENKQKLNSLFMGNSLIHWHWLSCDDSSLNHVKVDKYISKVTYYRILLPLLIPDSVEKILYFDCDMLILGEIRVLWQEDISDYVIAAVQNPDHIGHISKLGIKSPDDYFNAGMMLINTKRWRKEDITSKVLNFIASNPTFIIFWDQDALNAVLYHRWKKVSHRWNELSYMFNKNGYSRPNIEMINFFLNDVVVIHFAGPVKPWNYACQDSLRFLYFDVLSLTPWDQMGFNDINFKNRLLKWAFDYLPRPIIVLLMKIYHFFIGK